MCNNYELTSNAIFILRELESWTGMRVLSRQSKKLLFQSILSTNYDTYYLKFCSKLQESFWLSQLSSSPFQIKGNSKLIGHGINCLLASLEKQFYSLIL